jgi:peptidyl-prolyl cis-trans isomerase B (cyclophilin B)
VATSKTRQRALARAKAERQIARRAAAARRRRQWQAGIGGGVVLVLAVVGVIWAAGGFKKATPVANDCAWTAADTSTNTNLKNVGTPPVKGVQKSGSEQLTITTNQGAITAVLDPSKAPCSVANIAYLAGKKFFDNTTCGRLTTAGPWLLQCGDPGTSGQGGPTYRFANENVPPATAETTPSAAPSASASAAPSASASAAPSAAPQTVATYSRGVIAMYNDGTSDNNGSQFIIFYKDSQLPANYTVFGTVLSGLDVVDKIAAGGSDDAFAAADAKNNAGLGGGVPKISTVVQTLTVSDTPATTPSAGTAPSTTPSTAPSAS